jgi:hypothetical protein
MPVAEETEADKPEIPSYTWLLVWSAILKILGSLGGGTGIVAGTYMALESPGQAQLSAGVILIAVSLFSGLSMLAFAELLLAVRDIARNSFR